MTKEQKEIRILIENELDISMSSYAWKYLFELLEINEIYEVNGIEDIKDQIDESQIYHEHCKDVYGYEAEQHLRPRSDTLNWSTNHIGNSIILTGSSATYDRYSYDTTISLEYDMTTGS